MFPQPVSTLLLKDNSIEVPLDGGVQHDIGKPDPRLSQVQQAVKIATRPREGNRDRRLGAPLGPRRVDGSANFFGGGAMALTRFSRSNL
ncbi:hypothetical protein SAMN04488003_1243 [Loktanella fryxellensis]|uniref:Uncharacterized protein n=1 Tax=Loktanella fryxellensis TaxID=245187 RepID=A0A1H8I5R2_9RHOB|nr:hypothetical protein SAMN04488003_1243 [Loktanella fryxellensis]